MTHRGAVLALAAQAGAEVIALFVEDDELLRFAALPMAQEISMASLEWRQPEPEALRRSLRAHTDETERTLVEAVRRASDEGAALRLLLLADEDSSALRWAEKLRERLATEEPGLRLEIVRVADAAALGAALRTAGRCLVLLG